MIKQFTFNHFGVNTFVLWDDTKECAIIDVGCIDENERSGLYYFVEKSELKVKHLLLTHSHIDHFFGMKDASAHFHLPITMHKDGMNMMNISMEQAGIMGFPPIDMKNVEKKFINYGDKISFGNTILETYDVSGHCQGSIAYYCKAERAVFVGDSIFSGSIGRTDLYGGNLDELIENIRKNILTLPYDTTIFCGHGENTDVDYETNNNPFIND